MTVYSSVSLGEINEHPHPVAADGNARWPQVFFDDATFSFYRVRVTDADGVLIYDDDSVPIIGQAEGGGGGGGGGEPIPIDQNGLAKTGDVKCKFGTTADAGWVRMNGLTLGSSGSGATERANADAQALYEHLWNNSTDAICPVAGGRAGFTPASAFAANKVITLPDMRGRSPFGIDLMGNTVSAARIAATYMDVAGINQVGGSGGTDDIVLTADNLAAHQHPGAGGTTGTPPVAAPLVAASHTHLMVDLGPSSNDVLNATSPIAELSSGVTGDDSTWNAHLGRGVTADAGRTSPPATTAGVLISGGTLAVTGNTGSNVTTSAAVENMPPFMLFMFLIKL